ncbi:O-linked N-acetylglucosamine transferase, SPINDLY family protein [Spirulina sp. CCNP1310]|uniref:O-linked N-acetylglucosamine transferase, SPINDLY family protein n=1 Tax=Spirulina sp. CCNP1310 TaxID=3110249 RepID=UPI002B2027C9|nr:O-linked N-acetylglucosamine transferase, SPINDLY family protein [Spirulina sp. CCNP1310]MEA5418665.1 O-linked N-acetylglucosamine transferase, SPINDLY family protein [Spirulina sp. CCNP1310]
MASLNAQALYQTGQYSEAISAYESAIQANPDIKRNYWYLGLVLLLIGQSEQAEATWLMGMWGGESEEVEEWQNELITVLKEEAFYQEIKLEASEKSLKIREKIQELFPNSLENNLQILRLHLQAKTYASEKLNQANLLTLIEQNQTSFDHFLFMAVIQEILNIDPTHEQLLELVALSIPCFKQSSYQTEYANLLGQSAKNIGYIQYQPEIAAALCEEALKLDPNNTELTASRAEFYQNGDQYHKGIEAAKQHLELVTTLADRIDGLKTLLKALVITGGRWEESTKVFQEQITLLHEFVQVRPQDLTLEQIARLFNSYFFAPYFADQPAQTHRLLQQINQVCAENTAHHAAERQTRYYQGYQERLKGRDPHRKLRIGYLSFCLRRHSVGWLARGLFEHHDPEKYDLYAYLVTMPTHQESLQDWYISRVKTAFKSTNVKDLADAIFEDEIDILIELDSITVDTTCSVVMLKPAPIQVTWLGWDASGIPTIDYFIADDHVLPANAQDYYHEKIVRLPQSYIACDGFEVGLPTLRREDLEIPPEAIAYYSVQKGYKRHPDTMRLQLEIIKAVPGSYFLIKGSNDTEDMERAFLNLADEVGVERDRLKFLAVDYSEPTHRANMLIADIVLDTYPYNGATTTMETLWMGIPLVTRVGEQFAARNSYTMLINAGVTEGIAHNAQEYVQWGIRYGTDPELRQSVHQKLQTARRTAPLWNGRQFASHMEAAYEQMWADYLAGQPVEELDGKASF